MNAEADKREVRVLNRFAALAMLALVAATASAQSPDDIHALHDRVTQAIVRLSTRPLTPGDTFLTWYPKPGNMIHTLRAAGTSSSASLLRGDGMIGTTEISWDDRGPREFESLWTTRDSLTGKPRTDLEAHGTVSSDTLRVTGTKPSKSRIPTARWGVSDFGMEETLIPMLRSLPPNGVHTVSIYRPWHGRWDTASVAIRDTAGIRVIDYREGIALDDAKQTTQLLFLNARGDLLTIVRFDQPAERRPLEGSARYDEYRRFLPLIVRMVKRYRPAET